MENARKVGFSHSTNDEHLKNVANFKPGVALPPCTRYVAYFRVSTARQGQSGLGLKAQQAAMHCFLPPGAAQVADYVELESGRKAARPQLMAAIAQAENAVLLVAKLDRLARSVAFLERFRGQCIQKKFFCGMKPYSADLRERIAAACAIGGSSLSQAAARFSVSLSFINKPLKRQRTSGGGATLPHRGGPAPLLDTAARAQLAACVAQQPDATPEELRAQLAASSAPAVGRPTAGRGLQALDL